MTRNSVATHGTTPGPNDRNSFIATVFQYNTKQFVDRILLLSLKPPAEAQVGKMKFFVNVNIFFCHNLYDLVKCGIINSFRCLIMFFIV